MEEEIYKVLEENTNYSIGSKGNIINNKTGKAMKLQTKGNSTKVYLSNPTMTLNVTKMMEKYFTQSEGDKSNLATPECLNQKVFIDTTNYDIIIDQYKEKVQSLKDQIIKLETDLKQADNLLNINKEVIEDLNNITIKYNNQLSKINKALELLLETVNTTSIFKLRTKIREQLIAIKNI